MTYIYAILTNYDFKWHMSTSDLIQLLILMIATASLFYKIGTKKPPEPCKLGDYFSTNLEGLTVYR